MNMKYFSILALSILLTSCNSTDAPKESKKEKEPVKEEASRNFVKEYRTYLKGLKKMNPNSSLAGAKKFKELFKEADKATCDSGFVLFLKLYENLAYYINDDVNDDEVLQNTTWNQMDENGKSEPMPAAFLALEKKVKPNGYRLEFPEGMISVGYDRKFLAKHFYKFVTPTMRKYLKQMEKENESGFMEDGGIVIDEKEYVDRLVWWERFHKANPKFILHEKVKNLHNMYFTYFILGANNTPVYWNDDQEPIEITEYFTNAYTYLETRYPKSRTFKLLKPYREALLTNDREKAQKMLDSYSKKDLFMKLSKGRDLDSEWPSFI